MVGLVKGVGVLMFMGQDVLSGMAVDSALCLNHITFRCCSWSCNGAFYVGVCIFRAEK